MVVCSHGWRGIELTEDGDTLEVDDGGWLRGRGQGRWGTTGPRLRRRRAPGRS
jgi:hypothetical protein